MKKEIIVSNNVLNWIIQEFDKKSIGDQFFSLIQKWMEGVKKPTISQVRKLSNKIHIPFGYFFLKDKPNERIEFLQYRTVKNKLFNKPSRELIDTIYAMDNIRIWMSNYRKDNGFDKNIIASIHHNDSSLSNVIETANQIRNKLNINKDWYKEAENKDAYKYFLEKIQNTGIIVMSNGIVGNNTHRPLCVDEFRAFAIIDDYAPLIFINNSDSLTARIFSLLHEFSHIWLGLNDLVTIETDKSDDKIEQFCNTLAAELLVPIEEFEDEWNLYLNINYFDKIEKLSNIFKCSQLVIARRALDMRYISSNMYKKIEDDSKNRFYRAKRNSGGGDYYRTHASRYDINFIRAVYDNVSEGFTTYTEAYRLTNTTYKTYGKAVEERVETYVG